jgi:ATP-binding cassette subfamily F protein 3
MQHASDSLPLGAKNVKVGLEDCAIFCYNRQSLILQVSVGVGLALRRRLEGCDMSLIVAEGVTKIWTQRDVLKNVSFTLAPGQRVGLVGANGEGKTTLVRIIAGLEPATEGRIQKKSGLRLGYLPQDPPALEGSTLHQAMLSVFDGLVRMEAELHELAGAMGEEGADPKLVTRYGDLQHEFEVGGGYTYANRVQQILTGLGFAKGLWEKPLAHLSGGQRTRAYMARLLLEDPDVLLLDEPTNHLDLEALRWLEGYLQGFSGAILVVSHDRYFLDRVTTATWEIAGAALEAYKGGYSHYLTQRDERFKERTRRWEAQQEFIEKTEEFIRRFIAGQRSKEAQGRRTRLERFKQTEAIAKPAEIAKIKVRFKVSQRAGDFVLTLDGLKAGYRVGAAATSSSSIASLREQVDHSRDGHATKTVHHQDPDTHKHGAKPSHGEAGRATKKTHGQDAHATDHVLVAMEQVKVMRGQRVAIVGPNGCGKTTLLRTIIGQLPPLGGVLRWGANVTLGYLSQTHNELSLELTAIDALRQIEPTMTEEHARSILGSVLLSGFDAEKQIRELSGGQRSRVVLARLMLAKANVLLLDEPTNHLDVASQEALQDVLSEFDGTIILVSHDRYLISALATDIWAVTPGSELPGGTGVGAVSSSAGSARKQGEETHGRDAHATTTHGQDAHATAAGTRPGTVTLLGGNWDKYIVWRDEQLGVVSQDTAAAKQEAQQEKQERKEDYQQKRKRTNEIQKLQRQLQAAEKMIHKLEHDIEVLNAEINKAGQAGEVQRVTDLGQQYAAASEQLTGLLAQWEQTSLSLEEVGAE